MSQVIIAGDTSGSITLQAPATSGSSVLTLPVATDTLVGKATTDTMTNKTLTSPVIATIVNSGTLTLPTSTDTLVGKATTDTLTNKTLTSPVIATIVNSGTLTLPTSTDTLVGKATTDTLTNKSIAATQLTGTIAVARLPAGSVLQVVSASIIVENATTSTTFTSAGLSASITPTSATSKVLVLVNGASFGVSGSAEGFFTIDRSGTNLGNGNGGFGRVWNASATNYTFVPGILMVLDSPATTSSITYTVQYRQTNSAQYVYIGGGGGKSSIVLMEIAV